MLVTCQQVLLIIFIIARGVGFLYASTRRCIVTGYGKAYNAAIGEPYLLLYQAFTKRAATNNGGTIVILHSASEDFRRRGRPFVNEHHQWYLLV